MTAGRAAYPKYFLLPSGRRVLPSTMRRALIEIHKKPDADYPGWDWFSVPGHFIINEVRRGIDDRINMRAEIAKANKDA